MRRGAALLLALGLAPGPAAAQQGPAPAEPRALGGRLMATLMERGYAGFFDAVMSDTALGRDAGARQSLNDQRPRLLRELDAAGAPMAFEHASTRHWSPSFRSECYVVKPRRQPMLASLRYYRLDQDWNLVGFDLDTNFRMNTWDCGGAAPRGPAVTGSPQ